MWVKAVSLANVHTLFSIANSVKDNELLLYKNQIFYKHAKVDSSISTNYKAFTNILT